MLLFKSLLKYMFVLFMYNDINKKEILKGKIMFLGSSLPHACEQGQILIGLAGPLDHRWHSWPTSTGTTRLPSLFLACLTFFPKAEMFVVATFLVLCNPGNLLCPAFFRLCFNLTRLFIFR